MTGGISRRTLMKGLGATALGGALAACGSKSSSSSNGSEISIMAPVLTTQAPTGDGQLQKAIEKFSGKKLNITWVPNSDYGDRTNVTLASNDIPELMVIQGKTPEFVREAQAGAFWELTDKLSKYPNLTAKDPAIQLNSSINGKVFGVFRLRDPMRTSTMVRKDWLDKLGMSLPKTTDDLYQLAKAFKTENPNGDGKKDTYGLIIPKWPAGYGTASPYDVMEVWYGAPNGWGERNGKLVPGFDTEEFLAANTFMRKMASEGLINADFATMDSAKWNQPFFNGQGGIIIDVMSRAFALLTLFKKDHPKTYTNYVDFTGNLTGPNGKHSYPTIGYAGFVAVSKQSVPTESGLADMLSFLDKMSSKQGQVLENNGIEGVNFKVDGDYSVPITGQQADQVTNDAKSFAQLGTNVNGYLGYTAKPATPADEALYKKRIAIQDEDMKTAVQNPANALVSPTYTTKGAQLDQLIADARLKYVAGQLDLAGLKSQISAWHSQGGDQIISEMNDLYSKLHK